MLQASPRVNSELASSGLTNLDTTIHWLVSRQIPLPPGEDGEDGEYDEEDEGAAHNELPDVTAEPSSHVPPTAVYELPDRPHSIHTTAPLPPLHATVPPPPDPATHLQASHTIPAATPYESSTSTLLPLSPPIAAAGFNGRPSKPADTCYSFWVCGSLSVRRSTPIHPRSC